MARRAPFAIGVAVAKAIAPVVAAAPALEPGVAAVEAPASQAALKWLGLSDHVQRLSSRPASFALDITLTSSVDCLV